MKWILTLLCFILLSPLQLKSQPGGWETYRYPPWNLEFSYPKNLVKVQKMDDFIQIIHPIASNKEDPCCLADDCPVIKELGDLEVKIKWIDRKQVAPKSYLAEKVECIDALSKNQKAPPESTYCSSYIGKVTFGTLNGYEFEMGAEGCGVHDYYFPLPNRNLLKVQKYFRDSYLTSSLIKDKSALLKNPDEIFKKILSTLKIGPK